MDALNDYDDKVGWNPQKQKIPVKCCFCGGSLGAMVRLHQGHCCIPCFRDLLNPNTSEEET